LNRWCLAFRARLATDQPSSLRAIRGVPQVTVAYHLRTGTRVFGHGHQVKIIAFAVGKYLSRRGNLLRSGQIGISYLLENSEIS
jgi:hypothetical protein